MLVAKRLLPFAVRTPLRRAYLSWSYRGDAVECPCCGGRFREFMPHRGSPNVICPRCGAHERHRALLLYLQDRTSIFTERLSVLHLAPEEVFQKKLRAQPNLEYVSADLESPLAMVQLDITDIPYPDGSFDVILCSHVLEHVPDDRTAMRELVRVLKPDGWALLLVPVDFSRAETYEDSTITSPEERERAFWQADHVRLYGLDFPERLREAGFSVIVDPYVRELDPATIQRYGLVREYVYVGRKPAEGSSGASP
jgi:SAM-dependent methyltransferase